MWKISDDLPRKPGDGCVTPGPVAARLELAVNQFDYSVTVDHRAIMPTIAGLDDTFAQWKKKHYYFFENFVEIR